MTTPEVKTEAAPAPVQPAIDVNKIVADATKAATDAATKTAEQSASKIAAQKLEMIGRALTGEKPQDQSEMVLEKFVKDPLRALHTVKEQAKAEIREENAQQETLKETQRVVVMPFLNEYPELQSKTKLALVEKLAEDKQRTGMSYSDALKAACDETVKEFGLKSVSEAQRNGDARFAGLPGGGGYAPSAPKYDEAKSNDTFLSGMKARANSFRNKRTS